MACVVFPMEIGARVPHLPPQAVIWRTAFISCAVPRGDCRPANVLSPWPLREVKFFPSWRCLFLGASEKTLSITSWSWKRLSGSGLSWVMETSLLQCSSTLENTNISQDNRLAPTNSPAHPLSLLTLFATLESKDVGRGCMANKEETKTLQ